LAALLQVVALIIRSNAMDLTGRNPHLHTRTACRDWEIAMSERTPKPQTQTPRITVPGNDWLPPYWLLVTPSNPSQMTIVFTGTACRSRSWMSSY
jgi:hypothetical protein